MKLFDEWGNFVGDFVPAGSLDNCLFAIAIYIALAFFFVVYLVIKAIIKWIKMGVGFAKEGKWGEALGVFATIIIVIVIIVSVAVVDQRRTVLAREIQEQAQVAREEATLREKERIERDPPFDVKAWKGECKRGSGYYCPYGDALYIIVEITNKWDYSITLRDSEPPLEHALIMFHVDPGETERKYFKPSNIDDIHRICLEFSLSIPSYMDFWRDPPIPIVCKDI